MNDYFFKIGIRDNTSHKSESRYVNNISLIIKCFVFKSWPVLENPQHQPAGKIKHIIEKFWDSTSLL